MKNVFYVGYFDGELCSSKRRTKENLAGTMYMKGVINLLKEAGCHVTVVSLQIAAKSGIYNREMIHVDEHEDQCFLEHTIVKCKGHMIGRNSIMAALERFLLNEVHKDDIVISYHSLAYGNIFTKIREKIGYKWIPEINEIYCLSRSELLDKTYLDKELQAISGGDAYIFASDELAKNYANSSPHLIIYGDYRVQREHKRWDGEEIHLAYTGSINNDRGIFTLLQAMEYLPEKYYLHILGFGPEEHMRRLYQCIEDFNRRTNSNRVSFDGTRIGQDYTDYLADKQIGVSLISTRDNVGNNAFPGKISSYLGHSLYVVCNHCESIEHSQLAKHIFFCENTPEDIARVIEEIPANEECYNGEYFSSLGKQFIEQWKQLVDRA